MGGIEGMSKEMNMKNLWSGMIAATCIAGLIGFAVALNDPIPMNYGTPEVTRLTTLAVAGDTTLTGSLTVNGATNLNGTPTLVNGTISGNPVLGTSAANSLDLNVSTITINAANPGINFSTSTSLTATSILSLNGVALSVTANSLGVTGAATVGTTLGVTGKTTLSDTVTETYGVKAATGVFVATGGAVSVSTSVTSGSSLCLAGSFSTLPTTGYSKGCLAYQESDNTLYISTETVSVSGSWKAAY